MAGWTLQDEKQFYVAAAETSPTEFASFISPLVDISKLLKVEEALTTVSSLTSSSACMVVQQFSLFESTTYHLRIFWKVPGSSLWRIHDIGLPAFDLQNSTDGYVNAPEGLDGLYHKLLSNNSTADTADVDDGEYVYVTALSPERGVHFAMYGDPEPESVLRKTGVFALIVKLLKTRPIEEN